MATTRRKSSPQAQQATAAAPTHSQEQSGSLATQPKDSSAQSSKRAKSNNDAEASAQLAAPSPFMLPIELLADIFSNLDTAEVQPVSQVCTAWREATNDPRVWRTIRFKVNASNRTWSRRSTQRLQLLATIGTKAGNKVRSVDFAGLGDLEVLTLTQSLSASATSLKHILWSSGGVKRRAVIGEVLVLAKRSSHLETLELSCPTEPFPIHLLVIDSSSAVRLSRFSITALQLAGRTPTNDHIQLPTTLPSSRSTLFDHARSLAFRATEGESISLNLLSQILAKNPTLEDLTIHGLCADGSVPSEALSAPCLTSLEILDSTALVRLLPVELHAPLLRELAIDGRLLPKFSAASMASLSSLTLSLIGLAATHLNVPELSSIDRVKRYQGSLKLIIGSKLAKRTLQLLVGELTWPGLDEVEVEASLDTVGALVVIIAARQAGARGASEEQYTAIFQDAASRRVTGSLVEYSSRRPTRGLEANLVREAIEVASTASALAITPAPGDSLCSQVFWTVYNIGDVPPLAIEWPAQQPNVEVVQG